MKTRFFICERCGNVIAMIRSCGVAVKCCGENMKEVNPEQSDGAEEKHMPVYDAKNGVVTVSVGALEHPMTPEHYIEWICIETDGGFQYKQLNPGMTPHASFFISEDDNIKAVYAFCNRHSLWKHQKT